jgi:hypothetical protein
MIGTGRFFDEAAEPLPCVAGEIRFTELAVVDDVDTAIDLFLHGSRHGAANPLGIGRLVIRLPFVFCHKHLHEIRRPRQCPGVSDKNSFSAAFHLIPPGQKYWSDGVVEYWSIARKPLIHYSNFPELHHSNTPFLQFVSIFLCSPKLF